MAKFLALDTSDDNIGLALSDESNILAELKWPTSQNHSVELLPAIHYLLTMAGFGIRGIDAVFVARGPGNYTGLRVGVSVAKGLSYSLGRPLVSASTLELLAYPHSFYGLPVFSLMDAGHAEWAGAIFLREGDRLLPLMDETLLDLEEVIERTQDRSIICGAFNSEDGFRLHSALGDKATIVSCAATQRKVAFLVDLCLPKLRQGNVENIATFEPVYLRKPPITKPKRYTYPCGEED